MTSSVAKDDLCNIQDIAHMYTIEQVSVHLHQHKEKLE